MFSRLKKAKDYVMSALSPSSKRKGLGVDLEKPRQSFGGLLPELWDKIFGYLSPEEYLVGINTYPEWRELMKDQTASVLLPLVLPIVVDNTNLPTKSVLDLRLVNHEAKLVIDQILEEDSTSIKKHYENHTSLEWEKKLEATELQKRLQLLGNVKNLYVFGGNVEIENFLKHMGADTPPSPSTQETPLLSKSLLLQTGGGRADEIWRFMLLARYGHHVSELTCVKPGNIYGEALVHFVALLNHVPNLKILKLTNSLGTARDDTIEDNQDIQFPELKSLQLLSVEMLFENFIPGDEQYSICRLLLKFYGPQLTTLICAESFFAVVDKPALLSQLANLRILKLKSVDRNTLFVLSEVNWKLEELHISELNSKDRGAGFLALPPFCPLEADRVRLEDLVQALNNFTSTLTHFQLNAELGEQHFFMEEFNPLHSLITAPNIVKLTTSIKNLGYDWFWPTFNRKLPNLGELTLHTTKPTKKELEFSKWNFENFPKLERVRIYCSQPKYRDPSVVIITRNSLK